MAPRLLHFWGPPATLVTYPASGQPVLLAFTGRKLAGILIFEMSSGGSQGGSPPGSQQSDQIQAIHVIADPRQLAFLSAQLG
jgi:hypothetical protein